jgi:hypothetical protein
MNARRLILAVLAPACALICWIAFGVVPAIAAPTPFAPGEFTHPVGVAVNEASGDVYVAEAARGQVDLLEASGSMSSAFGKALFGPAPEPEGDPDPMGIAIDNELSSLSYGDVYAVDRRYHRVDKFDSSGKFLLMFGGDVNETTGGNVCVVGEACKTGTEGTADAHFELAYGKSLIAVGPGGAVYVGDRARVQVFEPSGVWRENISLAGLSSTGKVTALAVDSGGDMFVKIGGGRNNKEGAVPGVREFEPNGTERAVQFDAGSESVEALALDGASDLFVADSSGGGIVLEYELTGKKLSSLDASTAGSVNGMTYGNGKLYLSAEPAGQYAVWTLIPPVLGPPTIEEGSVAVVPALHARASLEAKFNSGGFEATYHFEYVSEVQFQAGGYANASTTPDVVVGSSLEEQSVTTALPELVAGAIYHYRLVVSNAKGTATSPDQTFQETASALLKGPWMTNVASTSATFNAEIDPLSASTEYRLEYGPSTSYGQLVSGSVGEGEGYVAIDLHRQELLPSTVYHYRIVTHNEFGTVEGADRSFTTQVAGEELTLPDGRVWELVSPPNKKGALIEPFESASLEQIQAASDGSGIAYTTSGPHVGEDPLGKIPYSQVLSRRGSIGWETVDLSLPSEAPENGEEAAELTANTTEYPFFSPTLSLAVVEPHLFGMPPLSPGVTERTLYLRDDTNDSFLPLVTAADVSPGTKIEEPTFIHGSSKLSPDSWEMHFLAATPDLGHVVFQTPLALTPNAIDEETVQNPPFSGEPRLNLYEWGAGKLQLVNILPNNEATHGSVQYVALAGTNVAGAPHQGSAPRAVSSDGRRIAWTSGEPYGNFGPTNLYVRDMVEEKTVQVGGGGAVYQTMNSDGSRIIFRENGDLYEFDYEAGTQTDLTASHGSGEASAGVQGVVSDVSEDGSYIYFVAKGVLASGGVSGEDNLYLLHDTGSGWTTTYIATLSPKDEKSWFAKAHLNAPALQGVSSRVSPDGRYLAFMSSRSLTGYDNIDAVSGQPDEEVYLFDAQSEKLVCASCDPTGARPVGILRDDESLAGRGWENDWLAGSVSGWDPGLGNGATYQPRYLSNGGRLFFDSPDALVPQDTDGLEDVYEYEPVGVSECEVGGVTFSERSSGCVSLISSGTSSAESVFYDASENGDDVFFATTGKLVGEDYDKGYDVYDAHVCSASVPCKTVPVLPPACTSGDSCKAAPSPQPEIFGPAPSATFNGVGNVIGAPSKSVVAPKSLTRSQKLALALRVCRKERAKRRGTCERQARKRYSAKPSRNTKATKKGNR